MPKKVLSASVVAKTHADATEVEIANMAAREGATVDWTGWTPPVAAPKPVADTGPLQMDASERAAQERGMASSLSPRGILAAGANLLPAAGATIGAVGAGLLGAPSGPGALLTGMGGEAAGAYVGEAARQGARGMLGLPPSQDPSRDRAFAGLLGAAGPLASKGVGAMGRGVSRQMYSDALSPTKGMLRDAPDMVEYGLEKSRMPVTQAGGGRVQSTERLSHGMAEPTRQLNDALKASEQAGQTVSRHKIVQALNRLANEYRPSAGAVGTHAERAYDTIREEVRALTAAYPAQLSPVQAQAIKQKSAELAAKLYDAMNAGRSITANDPIMQQVHKEIADAVRNEIRALPHFGERIDALNQALQPDIALRKAMENASVSPQPRYSPDVTKPASLLPMSRNTRSRLALGLSSGPAKALNEVAPRVPNLLRPWLSEDE